MIWLWIGDSISEGMQPTLEALFAAQRDRVVVEAHRGWTTRKYLTDGDLQALIENVNPDVVVYALGTNDVADGSHMNLEYVARAVQLAGKRTVIWVGPFISPAANVQLRQFFQDTLRGPGFVYGMQEAAGLARAPDDVHFLNNQYPLLAERLVKAVNAAMPSAFPWFKVGLGAVMGLGLVYVMWRLAHREVNG